MLPFRAGSYLASNPTYYWNASSGSLPPGMNFTSSSAARTYFDKNGILQTAAANAARFSYSGLGVPGNFDGLLCESAVTNLALWSRDLTNAAWVASSVTTAKNQTGLDNVASSCTSLTASGANGTVLQTLTATSAARTFSIYVKRLTGTGNIQMTQDNGTTWTTLSPAPSSTVFTRYQVNQTVANPVFGLRIVTSGDAIAVDAAQLQTDAVATMPVFTTSGSVTTTNDVLYGPLSGLPNLINPGGFTVVLKFVPYYSNSLAAARNLMSISDGTTSNRISMLIPASSTFVTGRISSGGSASLSGATTAGAVTANKENIALISLSGGQNALNSGGQGPYVEVNGASLKGQTQGVTPVSLTSFGLGITDAMASGASFTCFKELTIYPFSLDADMAPKLTTPK